MEITPKDAEAAKADDENLSLQESTDNAKGQNETDDAPEYSESDDNEGKHSKVK